MPQASPQGFFGRAINRAQTAISRNLVDPKTLLSGLSGGADAALGAAAGLGKTAAKVIGTKLGTLGLGPIGALAGLLEPTRGANDANFLSATVNSAEADVLRPVRQQIQTGSQGSTSVPAAALGAAPSLERTGRAFVPTAPPAAAASFANPMTSAPAAPSITPPTPPDLQRMNAAPGRMGFSAAVPQAALLRSLSQRPGLAQPAGYVATPEGLPFGAAPRRKIRTEPY